MVYVQVQYHHEKQSRERLASSKATECLYRIQGRVHYVHLPYCLCVVAVEDQPKPEEPVVIPDWRTIDEEEYDALDEEMRQRVDEQQMLHRREEKRK